MDKKNIIVFIVLAVMVIICVLLLNTTHYLIDQTPISSIENNDEVYEKYKDNENVNIIKDTTIQGIVEFNHNGHIYIFNGQHFGEYGFEMEEYTCSNIDNKNQKCLDYLTSEEYDTTYIEEGDRIICTGDLIEGAMMENDFNTKDNPIVVLKSKDYEKMKIEALNKETTITIDTFFDQPGIVYLKCDLEDKSYKLPFALKVSLTNNIEVIGNLEEGKQVKLQYEDEAKTILKSIEVIDN